MQLIVVLILKLKKANRCFVVLKFLYIIKKKNLFILYSVP